MSAPARPSRLVVLLAVLALLTVTNYVVVHFHILNRHQAGAQLDVDVLDALLDAHDDVEKRSVQADADADGSGSFSATISLPPPPPSPLPACVYHAGRVFRKPHAESKGWVYETNVSFGVHTATTVEAVLTSKQAASARPTPRLVVAWQASYRIAGDDAQRVLVSYSDDLGATWAKPSEAPTRDHDHGRGAGVPWHPVLFRPPREASRLMLMYAESRQCWWCPSEACKARQRRAPRLWRPGANTMGARQRQRRRHLLATPMTNLHRTFVYSHDGVKYMSSARAAPALTDAQYRRIRRKGGTIVSGEFEQARGPDAPRWSRGGDVRAMALDLASGDDMGSWSDSWNVLPEEEPLGDGTDIVTPKLLAGPPVALVPQRGSLSMRLQSDETWVLPFWAEAPRGRAMCTDTPSRLSSAPPMSRRAIERLQPPPRIFSGTIVSRDGGHHWARSPRMAGTDLYDTVVLPVPNLKQRRQVDDDVRQEPPVLHMLSRDASGATVASKSADGIAWAQPEIWSSLPNGGSRLSILRLTHSPTAGGVDVLLAAVNHHQPPSSRSPSPSRGNLTVLSSDNEGRTWHVETHVASPVRAGETYDAPSLKQVGCFVVMTYAVNVRRDVEELEQLQQQATTLTKKHPLATTSGVRAVRWRLRGEYCGESSKDCLN